MKKLFTLIIIIFLLVGCSNASNDSSLISYMEAKEKIINNGAILVDVRTEDEYNSNHISGAVLLTLDTIDENSVLNIVENKDIPLIVYCQSGNRSGQALSKLKDLGYEVYDLGSINNWEE